jgi:hypothetical protein
VPGPEAALVGDMHRVLAFPDVGVEVYRRRDDAASSVAEVRDRLRQAPDTRFAGRVLVDQQSGEPVLYTENLFVKFRDDADPDASRQALLESGVTIKEMVPYAKNAFFAAAPEGTGQEVFAIAQRLLERADVEYAHPAAVAPGGRHDQRPRRRSERQRGRRPRRHPGRARDHRRHRHRL